MKKTLFLGLAGLGLVAGIALYSASPLLAHGKDKAEWRQSHADRVEHRLERLKSELGLNDDQIGKIRDLLSDQQAKITAIREETHKKMAAVLTPEQKAKFESLKKERGEKTSKTGKL